MTVIANDDIEMRVRSGAGARSERIRRVTAAVEAGYLAQLSRDLRLAVARPARPVEPRPRRGG